MGYGKHQSFYLKSNWINKAMKAYDRIGMNVFFDVNNYKGLGIGKNMFQSLRYWMEATDIVQDNEEGHEFTTFGRLLNTYDSGCNLIFSLNLLHFNLCSKVSNDKIFSDVIFWYFNENNETISAKKELQNELILWNGKNYNKATSEKTILRDIECLIALYTKNTKEHPEDKNTSILAPLGLVKRVNDKFMKVAIDKEYLSFDAIMYILLRMNENGEFMNIDSILNSKNGIGRIFNLNRVEIIEIIEQMIKNKFPLAITRTNNLDIVKIQNGIRSEQFLISKYEGGVL